MTRNEQLLRDALETGLAAAEEVAYRTHESLAGYLPHKHEAVDADVAEIKAAIAILAATSQQADGALAREAICTVQEVWEAAGGAIDIRVEKDCALEAVRQLWRIVRKQAPAQQEAAVATWLDALLLVDVPHVHEALENFSHDSTEDNAIGLVHAILIAAHLPSPAPPQVLNCIEKRKIHPATGRCDACSSGRPENCWYVKKAAPQALQDFLDRQEPLGLDMRGVDYSELYDSSGPEPQAAVPSEREAFERWARTGAGNCNEQDLRPSTDSETTYASHLVERDWDVWQARAAITSPVVSDSEILRQPTIEECHAAGVGPRNAPGKPYSGGGLPNTPEERARFEAYMRGHCWDFGQYDEEKRCYDTTMVRMLYGVWRDRGALASTAPVVAEGFVIVPKVPNDEMTTAALWYAGEQLDFEGIYNAMIAAASPSAAQGEGT